MGHALAGGAEGEVCVILLNRTGDDLLHEERDEGLVDGSGGESVALHGVLLGSISLDLTLLV